MYTIYSYISGAESSELITLPPPMPKPRLISSLDAIVLTWCAYEKRPVNVKRAPITTRVRRVVLCLYDRLAWCCCAHLVCILKAPRKCECSPMYCNCAKSQIESTWYRVARLIGCLKLQVIFRKRATNHRALLREKTCEDKVSYDSTPPCSLPRGHCADLVCAWKEPCTYE